MPKEYCKNLLQCNIEKSLPENLVTPVGVSHHLTPKQEKKDEEEEVEEWLSFQIQQAHLLWDACQILVAKRCNSSRAMRFALRGERLFLYYVYSTHSEKKRQRCVTLLYERHASHFCIITYDEDVQTTTFLARPFFHSSYNIFATMHECSIDNFSFIN